MTLCWSLEPTDRPTFKLIGQLIDQLLQTSTDTSPHRGKQVKRGHVLSNVGIWLRSEIKLTCSFLNRSCTGTLLIARRRRPETHWREETMARSDGRQVTNQIAFLTPFPDFCLNSLPFISSQSAMTTKTTQWQRTSTSCPEHSVPSAYVKHRCLLILLEWKKIKIGNNGLLFHRVSVCSLKSEKSYWNLFMFEKWLRDYLCINVFFIVCN